MTAEKQSIAWPGAAIVGAACCALVNAVVIGVLHATVGGHAPVSVRLGVHAFDIGHFLVLGGALALSATLWAWLGPKRSLVGRLVALAIAAPLAYPFLTEDLNGPAERLQGLLPGFLDWAALPVLVAAVALPIPLAGILSAAFRRRWLRLVPLVGGLGLVVANHFLLKADYPGAHLAVASAAVVSAAGGVVGLPRFAGPRLALGMMLTALAAGAVSVLARPPNQVLVALAAIDGTPLISFMSRKAAPVAVGPQNVPKTPWFRPRTKVPARNSSLPRLVPDDAIVVYFSIDSVRADLFERDSADARRFPELTRLRDESVWFSSARAPGAQTVYTLSAVFAGTYFSQQFWSLKKAEKVASLWPWQDPTVRFPALLSQAGVTTVNICQAEWGQSAYGLVRGFAEDNWVRPKPGDKWSYGQDTTDALIARIEAQARPVSGPLFVFTHNLDPHAPYDLGGKVGTSRDRWMAELTVVDRQLGQIRRAVARAGLDGRTTIIVAADHGEGWGEHATSFHGQNLYDEQVRVPLFIRVPGVTPREVKTPVTLVDLGPTILDLMGVATPHWFMGESLVGFLRGQNPKLTRPIIAEGRMKQSIVLEDGFKVVRDQRSGSLEVYDLAKDPGELDNLYDDGLPEMVKRMGALAAFFETHKIRKKGYEIPYRR